MQTTPTQKQNLETYNTEKKGGFNMFEIMKKRIKNEKGLTLIELLAVIVILAIVAAIAIPAIGNIIENSRYNAVKADAINVLNASNLYFTDNADKTEVTVAELKNSGFLETAGKIPTAEGDKVVKGTPGSGSGASATTGTANKLTTTLITYSGNKTIKFTGATITGINKDTNKGSGAGPFEIKE